MKNYDNLHYDIDEVPIDMIGIENRFDRDKDKNLDIEDLAKDIKENGLHTEIWINKESDTEFYLIAGYRRLMAMKELGKSTIRSKIFSVDKMDAMYMICSENSNRMNYDRYERTENFLYLLHKEFLENFTNIADDFVVARYVNAILPIVRKIVRNDEGKLNLSKDEKQVKMLIDNVYERSGLFSSYATLERNLEIELLSDALKKFIRQYALSVRSMELLSQAEKEFSKDELDDIMKAIALLEKKTHTEIKKVINKYKAATFQHKNYENGDIIQKKMTETIDKVAKTLKRKDLSKADLKRLYKLQQKIEAEISKLSI